MDIQTNVAYLAALSLVSERLVEIVRGFTGIGVQKDPPAGAEKGPSPKDEAKRVAHIGLFEIGAGIVTAALANLIHVLPDGIGLTGLQNVIIFGVLAGAGSSFWNNILAWVIQMKNLRKVQARALLRGKDPSAFAQRA